MIIGFDAKRAFHNSSGLGNYSRDIIRILSNQFPQNKYLLYNPKKSSREDLNLNSNVSIKYPESWIWKNLSSVWRQGPISRQIQSDQVQIFHGLSNEIPRGINRSWTKVVVTIHDLLFIRLPELFKPVDRKIYFNKFRYAVENADLIIAISDQTKKDIIEYLKIDPARVHVHYQGCHKAFKSEYPPTEKERIKTKFSLPENYILNVGTIEKRKNALTLLRAIRNLDVHLVLIGKTTAYKNELIRFINENGIQNRIHFLQNVKMEELAVIYQMADLFCYPSLFEGFGIPVIEALYSKVPVITSEGGCFPEAGGPHSLYVASENFQAWENAITGLLENPDKRMTMASHGWQYAQKFNDDKVGNELMKLYQSLY